MHTKTLPSPGELNTALGGRLKALRLQRNLTQALLARDAGLARGTLVALESGRGTLDTLTRVLFALGRERELEALLAPDPPSTLEVHPPRRQRARR